MRVVFCDAQHGHGRPDLGRDLEVDKPLAAAARLPVEGDFRPLAVAFLARRKDVFLLVAERHHADDLVFLRESHAADAGRRPAHRPDVLAELGSDDDVALAVGQPGPHELALRPQAHGDDPAQPDVPELIEMGFLDLAVRRQHCGVLVEDERMKTPLSGSLRIPALQKSGKKEGKEKALSSLR